MFLLIVTAVVLFFTYIINQIRRPPHFPPGPSWLPFVGNLPELKKLSKELGGQHFALSELAKRNKTNVLGLKLGKDYVVTVFSYSVCKAVLLGEEYEGRPDNFFIRLRTMGTRRGVTCTDGLFWKTQRAFVMSHLKTLGYGKKPMDKMIKEEISEILCILEDSKLDVQVGKLLAPAVLNILWALTTGSRFSRKDPRLNKLLDLLSVRSKAFDMSGGTLTQHPWLRFIAPEKTGYNLVNRLNVELRGLLMETINEHYKNYTDGREDDLIYSYITQMKKENANSTFTDEQLVMICLDIFIAGSQTTSNTLDFALMAMILYPDVQKKVHAHIDHYILKDDELEYTDRNKLPYVEAVLMEVQRYFHVVPISGPRRVMKDTTLEGYSIPKETTILISQYSVHNDKEFWGDPEVFRPERFLDESGSLKSCDRIIPFGLGKRRCLGETLARNCIFLFFTEILRKYEISIVPGTKVPTGIPVPGLTSSPEKYNALFTRL